MTVLRPIAYAVDLLDRPGGHKTHSGAVPVVGGLAMLLGLVLAVGIAGSETGELSFFLISAPLLVIVGLFDDRFNVSPAARLAAQFVAVLLMVFGAGLGLHYLGDPFGFGSIQTGRWHLAVTAIVTMASINAFNMMDGLDGLAGGMALVAFGALLSLGEPVLGAVHTILVVALVGAVVGFLCFNVPAQFNRRVRCFMGDAGSTLLGFAVAWLSIGASQRPGPTVSPIMLIWFVAIPAADLVWTVTRRLLRRQSPLRADSEHLHHSFLRGGFGVRAVFATMMAFAIVGAAVGIVLQREHVPEWISLVLLVAHGVTIVMCGRQSSRLAPLLPVTFRRDGWDAPAVAVRETVRASQDR